MGPAAHLWGQVWAQFEVSDIQGHKTKGHATMQDIEKGISTHWEKRGNDTADTFAKQGAAVHLHSASDMDLVTGLGLVAHHAGLWNGSLEAAMAKEPVRDTDGLEDVEVNDVLQVDKEPGHRAIWKQVAEQAAVAEHTSAVADIAVVINGHAVQKASVQEPGTGQVIYCTLCGAYSWSSHRSLIKACQGPVTGMKTQRDRVKAGHFPHSSRKWRISLPMPLGAQERHELWEACGKPGLKPVDPGQGTPAPKDLPTREQVLLAFGIRPGEEEEFCRWSRDQRQDRARQDRQPDQLVGIAPAVDAQGPSYFCEVLRPPGSAEGDGLTVLG